MQRNRSGILLNQTKFGLQLRFSNKFGTKQNSVRCQINRKRVTTTQIWCDLRKFTIHFSVCRTARHKKEQNALRQCLDTQRNIFQILLNQTEIRLYLPCTN